jgi:hypothetical protein
VLHTYTGALPIDSFGRCSVLSAAFLAVCIALSTFIRDVVESVVLN